MAHAVGARDTTGIKKVMANARPKGTTLMMICAIAEERPICELKANSKYTDRVRLHPNLARLPPMPYRHRDSMSRKLRAMRDARERKRLEGVEPRYPRELPALR